MKSNKNVTQIIRINYFIALLPLIIYGFYKNGYVVYSKNLTNIYGLIKPLLIPLISYLIAIIIEFVFNKNKNFKDKLSDSLLPTTALLIACIINPNINLLFFTIVLTVSLIFCKLIDKIKAININKVALIKILFGLLMIFLFTNSYSNEYELNTKLATDAFDYIFGRNIGGIHSTNIFLCLIGYAYLSFKEHYKKDIPIYMLFTYIVLIIGYSIFSSDLNQFIKLLCNSSVVFSAIFIATDTKNSPYTKNGRIVYGLILGILTFVCIKFISFNEGVFIAILISSSFIKIIDKNFALK